MDNFEQVIGRLLLAHSRVKSIDPNVLSEKRLKERSKQLRALRGAIDELVETKFGELAADAKSSAVELEQAAGDLVAALDGIKKAIDVLDTIASALGTITSLVKLVKGIP